MIMAGDVTAETPVLEHMALTPILSIPSETGEQSPEDELPPNSFTQHTFSFAKRDKSGRKLPQAIAHRGYKAKFPENTLGAFKGAVKIGTQAIETDIHLSKDGVVVLSHDPDLKRCFGHTDKIIHREWSYLSTLRTLKEPHEPMPRLLDLLNYLTEPGLEDIWILLDIKLDNDAADVMRLIGETITNVPAVDKRPWNQRVVLGIWAANYLTLCHQHLPGFPVAYIGFNLYCTNKFFRVPNMAFNMLHHVLRTPCGSRFISKTQRLQRPIYAWTVNDESVMRWGIGEELDGIITDDPKKYLEVRDSWHPGIKDGLQIMQFLDLIRINIMALIFGVVFIRKLRVGDIPQQFGIKSKATKST